MKERIQPIPRFTSEEPVQVTSEVAEWTPPRWASRRTKYVGLTTHSFPPTLGVEGDIFMAEPGGNEIKQPVNPKPQDAAENISPIKPTPVERQADAWGRWTEQYLRDQGRKELTFEEKEAIEFANKTGRRAPVPVAGGQGEQPSEAAGTGQPPPPPEEPPTTPAGEPEREGRRFKDMDPEEAARYLEEMARRGEAGARGQDLNPGAFTSELGLSRMINDINDMSNISDLDRREQELRNMRDRVNRLFETRGQLNTPELVRQANQIDNYTKERLRVAQEEIARQRLAATAPARPRGMGQEDYGFYQYIENDNIDAKIEAVDADPNFPSFEAKKTEKERLMRQAWPTIKEYIRTLNPAGVQLDPELARIIIRYENEDAFEYLVNRIISHPVEAETKRYQSTFYGGINFSLITEAIKGRVEELRTRRAVEDTEEARRDREGRASWLEGLRTKFHLMESGAEFMHNLNRAVVMGSEREFVTLAPEMIPDHFQVLQRAKHASTVMRIFDEEIQRVMARDKLITMNNYAEVTGAIFDKGGIFVGAQEGTVERLLREINERLPVNEKLDEWERKWAFHAGRNLMNITIRTAELIAHSSGTEIGYKSFPQESIARIIDPIDLTGERFGISEQRGGLALTRMARENFREENKHHGWGKSNIVNILGMDRKKFEETGILNITGVFSGWRQENVIYLDVPDANSNLQHISIDQFIKYNNNPMGLPEAQNPRFLERGPNAPNTLRNLFLQNGELKPHFKHSFGVLLRLGQVLPNEKDNNLMLEAKRAVRTAIWKKIAKENPLAMANILYGMQLEPNNGLNPRLESLSNNMYATVSDVTREKEDTDLWRGLREKLTIVHEEKMRRLAASPGAVATLEEAMNDSISRNQTEEGRGRGIEALSPEESRMLLEIQNLGDSLSGKLAEVRFPSNPIMNDVMFETANYSGAGTEFYKRRTGGDLVQFYEAGGKVTELMVDPAGTNTEQALAAINAMVRALANPNGLESGENDIAPVFMAYLDFIREGGPTPKGKLAEFKSFLLDESMVRNVIKHGLRKGTSLAQKYGGILAPSHNIFEMTGILDQALKDETLRRGKPEQSILQRGGSLSRQGFRKVLTTLKLAKAGEEGWEREEEKWAWTDLYERFRKKYKVKSGWKFGAWIRDLLLVFGAGASAEFSQKTVREKV